MSGSIQYSFFTEAALKSTALLGVGLLAVSLLRRKSAAVRHQVWSAAFAALLILPLLSVALPALRVPVASSLLAPNLVFRTNAAGTAAEPARQAGSNTTAELPARSATRVDGGRILMTLWAAGAAASFAQMLIGWAALERLRRRAHACDMPGFEAMRKLLEIENEVRLLETANGSMPIMYGLFSPVIFLPADATEWNAERRRVVLLHELAHVRRRDGATHLLARTALVFYWWNPLAWTAWRLFLKERERAADDLVLGAGADAPEYAGHLLEIARSMQLPAAFGWAAIAMGGPLVGHSRFGARSHDSAPGIRSGTLARGDWDPCSRGGAASEERYGASGGG
jgi:beta-lactamase regulating signal transducer with metallopeptidase domain